MRAEEEHVQEAAQRRGRVGAIELFYAHGAIDAREDQVDEEVSDEDRAQEHGPAHVDQMHVRMEIVPRAAGAAHVELAVFVDDAAQRFDVLLRQARIEAGFLHIHPMMTDSTAALEAYVSDSQLRINCSGSPLRSSGSTRVSRPFSIRAATMPSAVGRSSRRFSRASKRSVDPKIGR